MGYTALYRKFRPLNFSELVGQEHITRTLKNQIIHTEDEKLKDFLLLAFSETVRLSSNTRNGEFKMYRMKAENVIKFNPDVLGIFTKTLDRNLNKVLAFNGNYEENINNS